MNGRPSLPRPIRIAPSAPTPKRRSQSALDLVRGERPLAVGIERHHEVVPGRLVLPDAELVHASSRCATIRSTASIAPSSPTSNQRIRGSRRNHAICRRASVRVRLTVCRTASSRLSSPAEDGGRAQRSRWPGRGEPAAEPGGDERSTSSIQPASSIASTRRSIRRRPASSGEAHAGDPDRSGVRLPRRRVRAERPAGDRRHLERADGPANVARARSATRPPGPAPPGAGTSARRRAPRPRPRGRPDRPARSRGTRGRRPRPGSTGRSPPPGAAAARGGGRRPPPRGRRPGTPPR